MTGGRIDIAHPPAPRTTRKPSSLVRKKKVGTSEYHATNKNTSNKQKVVNNNGTNATSTANNSTAAPPAADALVRQVIVGTNMKNHIPHLEYASIPSFDNFVDLVQDDHYIRLPSNWYILVADIEGSTRAIEQGRYRDVNTAGAMCIAAVRNAIAATRSKMSVKSNHYYHNSPDEKYNEDFPYVFGGDGASMVVPPHYHEAAVTALMNLSLLVQENYGLHLRVGCLAVADVEEQGARVDVARYEIVAGMCIALFRGGGLALADTLVKAGQGLMNSSSSLSGEVDGDHSSTSATASISEEGEEQEDGCELESSDENPPSSPSSTLPPTARPAIRYSSKNVNLDGLSCRWKKIPSKYGCVLSLLVMHNEDVYGNSTTTGSDADDDNDHNPPTSSDIYRHVLQRLQDILRPQLTLQTANPVNLEAAEYKSASEMVGDEVRMHARGKWSPAFWNRAVEIGLCHVIFKMKKLQHAVIDAPAYTQQMRTHADHCKFDDMIRMVIDCTVEQANDIEAYLQDLHRNNRQIFYGTQRSKHTLMTCLLKDTKEGNHIHFVDGDLGGYALAAKGLKMQLGNYAMAKRGMKLKLSNKKNTK